MRYITLSALFAAAMASPLMPRASTETVWTDNAGFVRNHDDSLASISFTLHSDATGDSFQCSTGANANPTVSTPTSYRCENSDYAFRLAERVAYGRYKLALAHQTGQASGLQGNMTIGCNGSNPIACSQVGKASTTLCSNLEECGAEADN